MSAAVAIGWRRLGATTLMLPLPGAASLADISR